MVEFINLTCPTCGGKLQITDNTERFSCGYCGIEHIVKRSGGIVTIEPVVQELREVKKGVDKTASELAIVRIKEEIKKLYEEQEREIRRCESSSQSITNELSGQKKGTLGLSIGIIFLALSIIFSWPLYDSTDGGVWILIIFISGTLLFIFLIAIMIQTILRRNTKNSQIDQKIYESNVSTYYQIENIKHFYNEKIQNKNYELSQQIDNVKV